MCCVPRTALTILCLFNVTTSLSLRRVASTPYQWRSTTGMDNSEPTGSGRPDSSGSSDTEQELDDSMSTVAPVTRPACPRRDHLLFISRLCKSYLTVNNRGNATFATHDALNQNTWFRLRSAPGKHQWYIEDFHGRIIRVNRHGKLAPEIAKAAESGRTDTRWETTFLLPIVQRRSGGGGGIHLPRHMCATRTNRRTGETTAFLIGCPEDKGIKLENGTSCSSLEKFNGLLRGNMKAYLTSPTYEVVVYNALLHHRMHKHGRC